jgi:hypothetical protein
MAEAQAGAVKVTSAGERVCVMQRPHQRFSRRHGSKEASVVDKTRNPVQVDDVANRQLP